MLVHGPEHVSNNVRTWSRDLEWTNRELQLGNRMFVDFEGCCLLTEQLDHVTANRPIENLGKIMFSI